MPEQNWNRGRYKNVKIIVGLLSWNHIFAVYICTARRSCWISCNWECHLNHFYVTWIVVKGVYVYLYVFFDRSSDGIAVCCPRTLATRGLDGRFNGCVELCKPNTQSRNRYLITCSNIFSTSCFFKRFVMVKTHETNSRKV